MTRPPAIASAHRAHVLIGSAMVTMFDAFVEVDEQQQWRSEGARDTAHWISMSYDVSMWKAHRWLAAARALRSLPRLRDALGTGRLGVDKVVELARFATPSTEGDLIAWARGASTSRVRGRADAEVRSSREELLDIERARSLSWWWLDDGRRMALEAELPAAEGAVVVRAIERLARDVPAMPDEEDAAFASARRADALVAMASAAVSEDPDPDLATVVVHTSLDALAGGRGASEVEDGPAIAPETVRRWLCSGRFQTVVEDGRGDVVRLGEHSRIAPAWMLRQVRYRDRGCRFPGCGARRFTQAHHITFWRDGGPTTLGNLVLICSFHHRLVHEHGWTVERSAAGEVTWRRPDGSPATRDGPPARGPTERMIA